MSERKRQDFPDRLRGPLSPEEKARIVELAERGLTPGQIALRMKRLPATVNWQVVVAGLAPPPKRRTVAYVRKGHEVVPFSAEEDAALEALRADGLGVNRIAAELAARFGHRRRGHSVSIRLKMLACAEGAE